MCWHVIDFLKQRLVPDNSVSSFVVEAELLLESEISREDSALQRGGKDPQIVLVYIIKNDCCSFGSQDITALLDAIGCKVRVGDAVIAIRKIVHSLTVADDYDIACSHLR